MAPVGPHLTQLRRRPRRAWWPVLVATALLLGAVRPLRRVRVDGRSMTPTLLPGDRLLVAAGPARWARRPAVGSVVAVRDPRRPDRILVKRVAAVDGAAGTCTVAGDNPPASTDSRQFGPVPLAGVVGRVVYRYGPPGRTGPLDRAGEYHRG